VPVCCAIGHAAGIAAEAENDVAVTIKLGAMIEKTRLDKGKKPTYRKRS
jgi:hypothetical protein